MAADCDEFDDVVVEQGDVDVENDGDDYVQCVETAATKSV